MRDIEPDEMVELFGEADHDIDVTAAAASRRAGREYDRYAVIDVLCESNKWTGSIADRVDQIVRLAAWQRVLQQRAALRAGWLRMKEIYG